MTLEVGMGNSECGNGAQGSKLKATETEARGQRELNAEVGMRNAEIKGKGQKTEDERLRR
jgi:hypothetical protein